jgi:predicted DNA-binding protein with PD1-like motif
MKTKRIDEHDGAATYAVVFDTGEEVIAGLTDFAKRQRLAAGSFTAIGGFSHATLGFFDIERKDYRQIPVGEQVEVLSLVGDVTLDRGEPKIHAHVVVGKADGTTRGGHVLSAHVRPTLEVIVVESPAHLRRTIDNETGLALIDL